MDLFTPLVSSDKLHPVFSHILAPEFQPEREVLVKWADGFVDRDNKFVKEFQITFEPCLWELYIFAFLKEIGATIDFTLYAPDFVLQTPHGICVEATISAPAQGTAPPVGKLHADVIPTDLNEFNRQATLRVCNSLDSKIRKYRKSYSTMPHVSGKPFVIALAPFDRPSAHMEASRPIMAALYGVYFDEEATMENQKENVVRYSVDEVRKNVQANVPVGLFTDSRCQEISAVIFNPLATWGKIRAMADNPDALSIYTTFHPRENSIMPIVRQTKKSEYYEHLLDGMYIFHNPFATHPLDANAFHHDRIAQFCPDRSGILHTVEPDDFLLMRVVFSARQKQESE
ncbi:glycosaminoglycan attachment site [bacterium]|nr:MAG: glycosaminoglycan attachment site [bacterium]